MSGFKINRGKYSIAGMRGKWRRWQRLWVVTVGHWGLPLGGDPRAIRFWELVVEKVESRLEGWSIAFLSRGKRLTLIQSVLLN